MANNVLTVEAERVAEARIRALEEEVRILRAALAEPSQLATILDHSPHGMLVHRGASPLYINAAFIRIMGLPSREAALALSALTDLVHPDDVGGVADQIEAQVSGDNFLPYCEFRVRHGSGRFIWLGCDASRIVWNGKPASLISVADITIRKGIADSLRRSEKLFSTAFRASPDPMSLTTMRDGRYVDINDAFLKTWGWKRSEVIGRTSAEIGFWKDETFRSRMVDALKRDGCVRSLEAQVRAPNGQIYDFIYSVDVIHFEDESLLLGIGRDVTELRRRADELRRSAEAAEAASRAKSEFLANMSHELRTPLNAILGFSEIIGSAMFGPVGHERYVDYARDIYSSGRLLLLIIDDLLDLSRLEQRKLEIRAEDIVAKDVIDGCLRLVESRAREARVKIEVELPATPLRVRADPARLKQVLLNLVSNAVKFTPDGGRIVISGSACPEGGAEFRVTDSGIGMSAAEIEVAMQPFGQVANAMTRPHQGAGLGLPLAKALVELHGGSLTVESAPGIGTRVTVRLPATPQSAPVTAPTTATQDPSQANAIVTGHVLDRE